MLIAENQKNIVIRLRLHRTILIIAVISTIKKSPLELRGCVSYVL
nr:MAG TPA: hypothetical protein [Caudoviricetes sp.]